MYNLLIVDDEAIIRNGLHRLIPWQKLGFIVIAVAPSAAKALEILDKHRVDALLTDIQMPGMNGLALCETVAQRSPHTKLVIITGYNIFDYAHTAIKLRVEDYILKPIKPREITEVFQKLRKKLDAECITRDKENRSTTTEDKFAVLQLIDSHVLAQHTTNKRQNSTRKQLLCIALPEHTSDLQRAVADLFLSEFFVQCGSLYVAFLPSQYATQYLYKFTKLAATLGCKDFRAVITGGILYPQQYYQTYILAVEKLEQCPPGKWISMEAFAAATTGDTIFFDLKQSYIRSLEEGNILRQQDITSEFFTHLKSRSIEGAALMCRCMLADIHRYFHVQPTPDSASLHAKKPAFHSYGELRQVFESSLEGIAKLLRSHGDSAPELLVQRTKELLELHYRDSSLLLSKLASQLNVSYNYLSGVFTRQMGVSMKNYLTQMRMEEARRLLLIRSDKISVVAGQCGYANPRQFADAFRRYYGVSASAYMQRMGGKHED